MFEKPLSKGFKRLKISLVDKKKSEEIEAMWEGENNRIINIFRDKGGTIVSLTRTYNY